MKDAVWRIPARRLALACTLGIVVLTVTVFLITAWHLSPGFMAIVGTIDAMALGLGIPFVYIGTKRIADPSLTFQGSDGAGRSMTMKFSRLGAIGFTCTGLVFYAGLLIGGIYAARSEDDVTVKKPRPPVPAEHEP